MLIGMRKRLALLLAVAAAAFAAGAVGPAPGVVATAQAHSCSSRYVHAVLPWGHKCLAAGQFCKRDGDRYYHRYGFHCHRRDSRGNYHLTR
jgi:hypothetical protein